MSAFAWPEEPERTGAREAMGVALRNLMERRTLTGVVLLAGVIGALAQWAGLVGARAVWQHGGSGAWWRAAILWVIGGMVSALAPVWALAGGLSMVDPERSSPDENLIPESFGRGVAMISLGAVEQVIYAHIFFAVLVIAVPMFLLPVHPLWLTAGVAAVTALAFLITAIALPAFRVGIADAATGTPPEQALSRGLAMTLGELLSIARFLLVALVFTAPLWLAAIALAAMAVSGSGPSLGRVVCAGAEGLFNAVSLLWFYAGLLTFTRGLTRTQPGG